MFLTSVELFHDVMRIFYSPPHFGGHRSAQQPRYGGGYASETRRYYDGRDNPEPCPCLGVFGMSLHTNERDLKSVSKNQM